MASDDDLPAGELVMLDLGKMGVQGVLSGVTLEDAGPPDLPFSVFDRLYAIPHPWDGGTRECYKGTPFDTIRGTLESTMLLPGEGRYLRQRLSDAGLPWLYRERLDGNVLLRLEERCPYCDNQPDVECPIFDHLPVMRRVWPLRIVKVGTESVSLHLSLEADSTTHIRSIDDLLLSLTGERWIGAWMDLARRIAHPGWWGQLKRTMPARYLHLCDIATPYDVDTLGVPRYLLKQESNPECPKCDGEGVSNMSPCPTCYTPTRLAQLLNAIQSPDNVFRPRTP